jgi:hypothetical protein
MGLGVSFAGDRDGAAPDTLTMQAVIEGSGLITRRTSGCRRPQSERRHRSQVGGPAFDRAARPGLE